VAVKLYVRIREALSSNLDLASSYLVSSDFPEPARQITAERFCYESNASVQILPNSSDIIFNFNDIQYNY
jgi:hypothetical protein